MEPGMEPGMEQPMAEPGTEEVMGEMEDERMAQMEAIAATAPQPEKPFSVPLVQKMVDELNAFLSQVDETIAQIEFVPEGNRIDGPLPPEVYVSFVLVLSHISQFEGYDKYMMNPEEFVNDAAVRKATAMLQMMQKDDALLEDMRKVPGEEEAVEEELPEEELPPAEPMPGEYDETDEALMASM